MNFEEIKALIDTLNASDLMFLDIKQDDFSLTLSKREHADTQSVQSVSHEPSVTQTIETVVPQEVADVPTQETGVTVNSPLVGVAYLAPSPESPVFKQVGDTVNVGDVLCIVEAMKIMNEIKSDVSGTLTAVLVNNQDIVEFDQPLFRIS